MNWQQRRLGCRDRTTGAEIFIVGEREMKDRQRGLETRRRRSKGGRKVWFACGAWRSAASTTQTHRQQDGSAGHISAKGGGGDREGKAYIPLDATGPRSGREEHSTSQQLSSDPTRHPTQHPTQHPTRPALCCIANQSPNKNVTPEKSKIKNRPELQGGSHSLENKPVAFFLP